MNKQVFLKFYHSGLKVLLSSDQKLTKRCTNNSLQSRDKIISSLLELIGYVLSISEYVLEKHLIAFDFDEKLMQSVTQVKIAM